MYFNHLYFLLKYDLKRIIQFSLIDKLISLFLKKYYIYIYININMIYINYI